MLAAGSILFGSMTSASVRAADDLDRKLMELAPEILQHARENHYRNVGVLKFRVGTERDRRTDSVLGRRLADLLEMALILKCDVDRPIGIAKQASDQAAKIDAASHLSVAGRRALFTQSYRMSWGNTSQPIDAFYTGSAIVHRDLSKITMMVQVVDPRVSTLTPVKLIEIIPDVDDLVDAGQSFRVRGIFDNAELKMSETERKDQATTEAVLTSLKTVSEEPSTSTTSEHHPLSPDHDDAPIRFEVRYDGQPQTIHFAGGQAFVAEPSEGQRIEFVVTRPDRQRPRLAVVVKVNGENTLRKQTVRDAKCGAWIFEPTMDIFGIKGFQLEGGYREPFTVLSESRSAAKEIDYGEHAGTVSITVFPERVSAPEKPKASELASGSLQSSTIGNLFEGEDFKLLSEAMHPKKTPSTLASLQSKLDPRNQLVARGLIVGGSNKTEAKVEKTEFQRDSIPLMSATLRYRAASDLPQ